MIQFSRIIRFGLVGVANTAVDVGLYVMLHQAGMPVVLANILSTSVALGISYTLNYRYTFGSSHSRSRLIWFLGITCAGLWLLQPLVITSILALDNPTRLLHILESATNNNAFAYSAVPKLAATGFTLIWNYLWYSRKIFTHTKDIDTTETSH